MKIATRDRITSDCADVTRIVVNLAVAYTLEDVTKALASQAADLDAIAEEMWPTDRAPVTYDDHGLWAWSTRIRAIAKTMRE